MSALFMPVSAQLTGISHIFLIALIAAGIVFLTQLPVYASATIEVYYAPKITPLIMW